MYPLSFVSNTFATLSIRNAAISHLAFFLPLRHQNTKFHEGEALTLCYSLCPLSLCGYFSPPHEKLLSVMPYKSTAGLSITQ
jgi:hypothetical protein